MRPIAGGRCGRAWCRGSAVVRLSPAADAESAQDQLLRPRAPRLWPGCWSSAGLRPPRAASSMRAATGKSRASAGSPRRRLASTRVEALVLQAIGAQLVDQADAAAFLAQVEQDAAALAAAIAAAPRRAAARNRSAASRAGRRSGIRNGAAPAARGPEVCRPITSATCSRSRRGCGRPRLSASSHAATGRRRACGEASAPGRERGEVARRSTATASPGRRPQPGTRQDPGEPRQLHRRRGVLRPWQGSAANGPLSGRTGRAPDRRSGAPRRGRAARRRGSAPARVGRPPRAGWRA